MKGAALNGTRTRRDVLKAAGAATAAWMLPKAAHAKTADSQNKKPNFVIIFTDDQGYHDLGCYGSEKIDTPNLDRMAKEGVKFTDFYSAASICTPSRAALMTGCYAKRVGLGAGVIFPKHNHGLNPKEITIADLLKKQGYATKCIGKWHLGHKNEFLPTAQGFDSYFGIPYSNDMHHEFRGKKGVPLMRDNEVIEQPANQNTLTKRYTEEAVKFIKENRDKPFLCYLPHTMPHVPLHASEEFRGRSDRGLYGDVIEEIDWSTGQIIKTLKDLGIDENTLVIFTSDNGPWLSKGKNGGSAKPLRNGKFSTYEGGFRMPCIMRWAGKIPAGKTCRQVASTLDVLPTLASLAGTEAPGDRIIDGHDISKLLMSPTTGESPTEAFYYYSGRGKLEAVRCGKWKLRTAKNKPELYNLREDIGEKHNLADENPDLVEKLQNRMNAFDKKLKNNSRPAGR